MMAQDGAVLGVAQSKVLGVGMDGRVGKVAAERTPQVLCLLLLRVVCCGCGGGCAAPGGPRVV
jgi:hypothetical protein